MNKHWQSGRGFDEGVGGRATKLEVSWNKPLGNGRFGTVYEGRFTSTQHHVAIKAMPMTARTLLGMELGWYVAVAKHPDIVTILDVDFCPRGEKHLMCLVFERYEIDVKQFLEQKAFELAGLRHVVRKVVSALTYMHGKGIMHADLQPANLLMRPEDFAAAEWSQWLGMPRICESDLHAPLFGGCISPRGCIFKVVVGDLGSAGLACPEERC